MTTRRYCLGCSEDYDQCSCGSEDELTVFGSIREPGWVGRGTSILLGSECETDWSRIWPEIKNNEVAPAEVIADFYLLEAVTSNSLFPVSTIRPQFGDSLKFKQEFGLEEISSYLDLREAKYGEFRNSPEQMLMRLQTEAQERLDALVAEVLPTFRYYTHMAIAGEARYHFALRQLGFPESRDEAWCEWREIWDIVGNSAIMDLVELFHDFDDDSYGGPLWGMIAEILYCFEEGTLGPDEKSNARLFLDRIFSLEHNSGNFLTKTHWQGVLSNPDPEMLPVSFYSELIATLNEHSSEEPDYGLLWLHSSQGCKDFIAECEAAYNLIPLVQNSTITNSKFYLNCDACGASLKLGHFSECNVRNILSRRPVLSYETSSTPSPVQGTYALEELFAIYVIGTGTVSQKVLDNLC